jgi:hypothetical protein
VQMKDTDTPPGAADLKGWRAAFADDSGARFSEIVAPAAVLEGSVFAHPITGRDEIWHVLRLSGSLYDRLEFTHEVIAADRTYLEWEASASGLQIWGVTALTKDTEGHVIRVAMTIRPLGAVNRFSAALADGLTAILNRNVPRQPEHTD